MLINVLKKKVSEIILNILISHDGICNNIINAKNDLVVSEVSNWAINGDNTDDCLKKGFLPVPVHFYQPIPDIKDLKKRKTWDHVSEMSGIEIKPKEYLELIKTFSKNYSKECIWPYEKTENPKEFYLNNGCFSFGCAMSLHCMIREYKPKRIIEIGSGNSSKIIRDAIILNEKENSISVKYSIIDPYSSLSKRDFTDGTEIIKKRVELLDSNYFKSLNNNDILFIDSSHVSKIGSDVNFEILEVLPKLNKGVIIHFHDISLPWEYPMVYSTNSKFRVFWTEAYLLQAFLAFNNYFKILLPMAYTQNILRKDFIKAFPILKRIKDVGSGSFWIKKIK